VIVIVAAAVGAFGLEPHPGSKAARNRTRRRSRSAP